MTFSIKPNLVVLLASLLLFGLLLSACNQVAPDAKSPAPVENRYRTWNDYLASLNEDSVGKYKVVAANAIEGENGLSLSVEERYYVELEKTRIVAEQDGLGLLSQSADISDLRFSLVQADQKIQEQAFNIQSLNDSDRVVPKMLFASQLYNADRATRDLTQPIVCGNLKLTFVDKDHYPIVLNTCNRGARSQVAPL